MKQKILAAFGIFLLVALLTASTTINGTRIISNALTVQGVFTAATGAVMNTPASINLTNATALPCAALPALTGSVSSAGGTCTTTGGGSGVVLIEQHTASASASLDFTTCISSTYDDYQIEFINLIPGTTAQQFRMRVSTDGGSTYDSGSNYKYLGNYNGFGDVETLITSTGTTQILVDSSQSTQASWSMNGTMTMQNPGSASLFKATHSHVSSPVGAGNLYWWINDGIYASNTAVNAFQFFYASGNIASGTIRCYGVAKT